MERIYYSDYGRVWAIDYDGLNVVDVAADYEKMTAGEIKQVVINEGGIIDNDGTIHRGSAKLPEHAMATSDALEEMNYERLSRPVKVFARGSQIGLKYLDRPFYEAMFGDIVTKWTEQRAKNDKELTAREVRKALENHGYYVDDKGIIRYNPRKAYKEGSEAWLAEGKKLRDKAEMAMLIKQHK